MEKGNKMQFLMKKNKISMRDMAAYTGTNLSLVCYIVRGFAKFPTEEELAKCCELLKCKPTDIYPKRTLQVYYPQVQPKRPAKPRERYGNPSVRVNAGSIEIIKAHGYDVSSFVNRAVNNLIKEEIEDGSSNKSTLG